MTDAYGTVGGGYGVIAGNNTGSTLDAAFATVGGGAINQAAGHSSTIAGGFDNLTSGIFSTIAGGTGHRALGQASTVGGGQNNAASGIDSTVAGGQFNTASNMRIQSSGTAEAGHTSPAALLARPNV